MARLKSDYLPSPKEIAQHTARFRRKHLEKRKAEAIRCGRPRRAVVAYKTTVLKSGGLVMYPING